MQITHVDDFKSKDIKERLQKDENEYYENILDRTMLEDGQDVLGLVLVRKFEKKISQKNGYKYASLYCLCKYGNMIQLNLPLGEQAYFTDERLKSLVNKVVTVKGIVNVFKGITIIDATEINLLETGLTLKHFLVKRKDLDQLLSKVNGFLRSTLSQNKYAYIAKKIIDFKLVSSVLADSSLGTPHPQIGDGLLEIVILMDTLSYQNTLTEDEKTEVILLSILYKACDVLVSNKEPDLVEDSQLFSKVESFIKFIRNSKILENNDKLELEFHHIFNVMNVGDVPKTVYAKIYEANSRYVQSVLHASYMQEMTSTGTTNIYNSVFHVRR